MRTIMTAIFAFAASVKLAVLVILLLAVYLGVGTFYESRFGVTPALDRVYGHWTFMAIMVLLAVNVLAAALIRYPWKRHQTGFVITHTGLLTLLAGGLISYRYSIDGFLPLSIGQTEDVVSLRDERLSLTIDLQGRQRHFTIPVDYYAHAGYPSLPGWVLGGFGSPGVGRFPEGRSIAYELDEQIKLEVLDWMISAEQKRDYVPQQLNGPAVKLLISGSAVGTPQAVGMSIPATELWLDDTRQRGVIAQLFDGLIEVSLSKTSYNGEVEAFLAPDVSEGPQVVFRQSTSVQKMGVDPAAVGRATNLPGGWTATLRAIGDDLRPTVSLRLEHKSADRQDVLDYELDALHGHVVKQTGGLAGAEPDSGRVVLGPAVSLVHPGYVNRLPESTEVRGVLQLLQGPDGRLYARVVGRSGVLYAGEVTSGQEIPAWMKLNVKIERHVPSARLVESWERTEVSPANLDKAVRAARVALTVGGQRRELTLARGAPAQTISFASGATTQPGDVPVATLAYGYLGFKMPFSLTLMRAEQVRDQGAEAVSDFVSELMISEQGKPPRRHVLNLNQPLSMGGLAIYHLSMDVEPTATGKPMVTMSTLSVRKDPGTIIKYIGGLLVCLGVFAMFYMKAYYATGKPRGISSDTGGASSAIASGMGAVFLSVLGVLFATSYALPVSALVLDGRAEELRPLAVVYQDRVQPLDSLSRQVVHSITGRRGGSESLEWVLGVCADPARWDNEPVIYVPNLSVRAMLNMPPGEQRTTPRRLRQNPDFMAATDAIRNRQAIAQQRQQAVALSPQDSAALAVRDRYELFEELASGRLVKLIRAEGGELTAVEGAADPAWQKLLASYRTQEGMSAAVAGLVQQGASTTIPRARLDREVLYNELHPFRLSAYAYTVALLMMMAVSAFPWIRDRHWRVRGGLVVVAIGMHVAAFVLRCSITGFAPVTNLYETVVWVGLVAVLVAAAISRIYGSSTMLILGTALAATLGFIADLLPADLGHSIKSLTPILRSNVWLTVHVLPIVSSYAAFAVAMMLGNVLLVQHAMLAAGRTKLADTIRSNTLLAYRAVQVGVLLVIAGTILGGLWADLSWGRFWGWDPKEVWALIICLTYLAVLHGRFAGWVKPLAFAASCVLAWLTVIMSWYGVNFVLGIGLHSYGFGTGGQIPVGIYCAIQLIFVVVTVMLSMVGKGVSAGATADPS